MVKKINIDTKTFVRFWLVILGLGMVAAFVLQAWTGIFLVLLAAFLAVALMPLAKRINKIDRRHNRDSLSSVLAVVLIVTLVVGIVSIVGPILVGEIAKFAGNASTIMEDMTSKVDLDAFGKSFGVDNLREQVVSTVGDWSKDALGGIKDFALTSIGAFGGFIGGVVIVIVLTILFMLQGPDLLAKLWKAVEKRRGQKAVKVWSRVTSRIAGVIAKYISGQAIVALLDAIVSMLIIFLVALIFNIPMSLVVPLGLMAGVMYMIPMFGPVINCVVAALLIAFNSIWGAMVYVVLYLIYEQLANNVIAPKIQGKGMGLSPLIILIAITIGTYAFGIIGTFIAIPVAGCIKVLIEEYPNIKSLE